MTEISPAACVALTFTPSLSMTVKRHTAKRMLEYPDALAASDDPMLSFALQNLGGGTVYNHIVYALTWPLGQLDALIDRVQDRYEVWRLLRKTPAIDQAAGRQSRTIDWEAEIGKAAATKSQRDQQSLWDRKQDLGPTIHEASRSANRVQENNSTSAR